MADLARVWVWNEAIEKGFINRQILLGSHAGKQSYFSAGQMLEQRNHAANANHRQNRAKPNANQVAGKQKPQQDGESDVAQVKAVFGKAHVSMDAIRKGTDPKEAYEKNIGTYGRYDEAVKYIDPWNE